MIYIIDSYAWVEYFLGSKKGEVLKKLFLDQKNKFFTVECSLAEMQGWALKNNKQFDEVFTIMRANSDIIPLTEANWIAAGKERFEQRKEQKDFGLMDALILTKQKEYNAWVISGDKHFKSLKNVIFLE